MNNREVALKFLEALNLAVVGFGMTKLVIAAGENILLAEAASVALGHPTVYCTPGVVVPRTKFR